MSNGSNIDQDAARVRYAYEKHWQEASLCLNDTYSSQLFHQIIHKTQGGFCPQLKQEVQDRKGHLERARMLFRRGIFASDWDRISKDGIVSYIIGKVYVLLKRPEFKDTPPWNTLSREIDWVIVEEVFFRFGYVAPDFIEAKMRANPKLREALTVGVPLFYAGLGAILKLGGAGAIHGSPELGQADTTPTGQAVGYHSADAAQGLFDNVVGGEGYQSAGRYTALKQIADTRGLIPVGVVPTTLSQLVGLTRVWPKNYDGVVDLAAELWYPFGEDAPGLEAVATRKAFVFKITPVKLQKNIVSFKQASVVGVRSFQKSAEHYLAFYNGLAKKTDEKETKQWLGMSLPSGGIAAWLFNPFWWRQRRGWELDDRLGTEEEFKEFFSAAQAGGWDHVQTAAAFLAI